MQGAESRSDTDEGALANAMLGLTIVEHKSKSPTSTPRSTLRGISFWGIASNMIRALTHLSSLFASYGLLPEVQYYLRNALRVANSVNARSFQGQIHALMGRYLTRGGECGEGLEKLSMAESVLSQLPHDHVYASLQLWLAYHNDTKGQLRLGRNACSVAEKVLAAMTTKSYVERLVHRTPISGDISLNLDALSIEDPKEYRRSRGQRGQPLHRRGTAKSPKPQDITEVVAEELPISEVLPLQRVKDEVKREQALAAMANEELDVASAILQGSSTHLGDTAGTVLQSLLAAQIKFQQNLVQLVTDPVFGVLPESTLSCPSTKVCSEKQTMSNQCRTRSTVKTTVSSKDKRTQGQDRKTMPKPQLLPKSGFELLRQAQTGLNEISPLIENFASTTTLHHISAVLSRILLMLSACPSLPVNSPISPTQIAYHLGTFTDLPRINLIC